MQVNWYRNVGFLLSFLLKWEESNSVVTSFKRKTTQCFKFEIRKIFSFLTSLFIVILKDKIVTSVPHLHIPATGVFILNFQ